MRRGHDLAVCSSEPIALIFLRQTILITTVVLYGTGVGKGLPRLTRIERRFAEFLHFSKKYLFERFLGAMQQHPEILATYTDVVTDLVLIRFV